MWCPQYACRNGRSELVKFLVCSGADLYLRSDMRNTPIDDLEVYDIVQESHGRKEIAKIVNILVQDAGLDPFDWRDEACNFDTLTLWRGLPYENLRYLLFQNDIPITVKQYYSFILDNLLRLEHSVETFQDCIDLLISKYTRLRREPGTRDDWPYGISLLRYLIINGLLTYGHSMFEEEVKISRCLMLTNELYDRDEAGTPLDYIARLDKNKIGPWLELLSRSKIDIGEYLQYESDQHPDGIVFQGRYRCCRNISLKFRHGENNAVTPVEVENVCAPEFQHLDPEYRCEVSRSRERCITRMEKILVDDRGKPIASAPGCWTATLKPNSSLILVHRIIGAGWQYVDFEQESDWLWDHH
jgi:hypothetical protein